MPSISHNLEAEFIFPNLHPEVNEGKVKLLGTEQSRALNDVLLSCPITVPSLAATCTFSRASFSERLLWENLILVQFPQGPPWSSTKARPQDEEFSTTEQHFKPGWSQVGTVTTWGWSHLCWLLALVHARSFGQPGGQVHEPSRGAWLNRQTTSVRQCFSEYF